MPRSRVGRLSYLIRLRHSRWNGSLFREQSLESFTRCRLSILIRFGGLLEYFCVWLQDFCMKAGVKGFLIYCHCFPFTMVRLSPISRNYLKVSHFINFKSGNDVFKFHVKQPFYTETVSSAHIINIITSRPKLTDKNHSIVMHPNKICRR